MGLFTNFDTGGQLFMHRLRMRFQNLKTTLKITFLFSLSFFLWRSYQDIESYAWQLLFEKYQARVIMMFPLWSSDQVYQKHLHVNGRYYEIKPSDIVRDPRTQQAEAYIINQLLSKSLQTFFVFVGIFSLVIGFFIYIGSSKLGKKTKRGAKIEKPKVLTKMLKKRKKASDLNLDGIPLLKDAETQHVMLKERQGLEKQIASTRCFPKLDTEAIKPSLLMSQAIMYNVTIGRA